MAGYIDLNPVRAGIVTDPKDYRWSGYGEAVAGKEAARTGLRLVLFEELSMRTSEERAAGEERDEVKNRAGIPRARVAKVLASGGELSEAELLWWRSIWERGDSVRHSMESRFGSA